MEARQVSLSPPPLTPARSEQGASPAAHSLLDLAASQRIHLVFDYGGGREATTIIVGSNTSEQAVLKAIELLLPKV